jgi:hypothetical protein
VQTDPHVTPGSLLPPAPVVVVVVVVVPEVTLVDVAVPEPAAPVDPMSAPALPPGSSLLTFPPQDATPRT